MLIKLPPILLKPHASFHEEKNEINRSRTVPRERPNLDHRKLKQHPFKPFFVARKLVSSDLTSTQDDQISPLILTQGASLTKVDRFQIMPMSSQLVATIESMEGDAINQDESRIIPSETPVNIFESEKLYSARYKEVFKGPQYRNGKVVKHSLVGDVETFINCEKRAALDRNPSPNRRTVRFNTALSFKSMHDLAESGRFTRSNSRKLTLSINAFPSSKTEGLESATLPRKDYSEDIRKFKGRQEKFYSDIDTKTNRMALHNMLAYSRDKRVMEKFEKTQQLWEKCTEVVNNKIGRTKSESLITKTKNFREKVENAEAIEIGQPDEHKFGKSYWYLQLRRYKNESKGTYVRDDLPAGFSTIIWDKPKATMEIIRKPKSIMRAASENASLNSSSLYRLSQSNMTESLAERPTHRSAVEYLNKRLNESARKLKTAKANGNGLEDLEVI